jgi:post-segregation antitoxin (ccd killing protein)
MIDFNAHFDGKVIVPEQAVDLPRDRSFVVHIEAWADTDPAAEAAPQSALQWLAENAVDDELPRDLSAQHDHYLYGTPKRG